MRVRLHKTNNKLIPKWHKHGSSSSNPTRTKHRDAAKIQLLSSLSTSVQSSTEIQPTRHVDHISQYSKTTLGTTTTTTNASMIQVNEQVIQVNRVHL